MQGRNGCLSKELTFTGSRQWITRRAKDKLMAGYLRSRPKKRLRSTWRLQVLIFQIFCISNLLGWHLQRALPRNGQVQRREQETAEPVEENEDFQEFTAEIIDMRCKNLQRLPASILNQRLVQSFFGNNPLAPAVTYETRDVTVDIESQAAVNLSFSFRTPSISSSGTSLTRNGNNLIAAGDNQ